MINDRSRLTPRLRQGLATVGVVVVAVAAGGAVALVHGRLALVILVGLVCVAPIVVRLVQLRLDVFEPIVPLSVGLVLIFFIRPVVHLASGQWFFRGFDVRPGFSAALVMALLGILGLFAGYSLRRSARTIASRLPVLASSWTPASAHRFVIMLLATGALLFAGYILQLGGFGAALPFLSGRTTAEGLVRADASAYLYFGPFLAIPGALILIETGTVRRRAASFVAGLITAMLVLVVTVPRGDRFWLGALLLSLVVASNLRRRRRPKLVVILALALVFVVGINALLSHRVTEERKGTLTEAVTGGLATPKDQFESFALGPDIAMFSVLSLTADQVPAQIPHHPGASVASLLVAPIPDFVWRNKPQPADVILYSQLFPKQGALTRSGTSASFFGGLYFDGGYVLVVLGGALIGLLARMLFEWWRLYPDNGGVRLAYAASLPLLVFSLRGSPTDLFARALYAVGPIVAFAWWVRSRSDAFPAQANSSAEGGA